MIRLLVLSLYAAICIASSVPINFQEQWGSNSKRFIKGNCTVTLPRKQMPGKWSMKMLMDKGTASLEIWRMNVISRQKNGKEYNLKNKFEYDGTTTVTFILTFRGRRAPTGRCYSAFDGKKVKVCEYDDDDDDDDTPTSTTTKTTTTTMTTPTSTTSIQSSTTSSTSMSSTNSPTTTSSSAVQTPIVPINVSTSWPVNGAFQMEGHCIFKLNKPIPKFYVRVDFDKETSSITEWHANVIRKDMNGLWYYMKNKNPYYPPKLDFNFHVKYFSEPHPQGACTMLLPGDLSSTTSNPVSSSTTSSNPTQSSTSTSAQTSGSTTIGVTTSSQSTSTSSTASTPSVGTTTTQAQTSSSSIPTTTSKPTTSGTQTPVNTKYYYTEVLHKSILFYEAQRSGQLPASNRIPYRGDSALNDKGQNGEDLTGGWYDAGDHVKFNFPMASSTTLLALGFYLFQDGYVSAGEENNMYDSIKWPLDYFLKCWREDKNNLDNSRYYATVGDPGADHAYWGRPEDMTMNRPAYYIDANKRGSDVGAETAAALAAGALAFGAKDPVYASILLQNAESLYTFSKRNRGIYSNSLTNLQGFYSSSGDQDELCESAILLYMATGKTSYLNDARTFYQSDVAWSLSWDLKTALCQVLLLRETGDDSYKAPIESFMNSYMNGGVPQTPCGLTWRSQWGSLRYSANAAYIAMLAAETGLFSESQTLSYTRWAMSQIHYMLGDNKYGRSYVVGFGNNPPVRPHHRAASCPSVGPCGNNEQYSPDPNPQILYGALVGGPDQSDNYKDERTDYIKNEVATDYNAGFQSAVAALQTFAVFGELPPAPVPKC